METFTSQSRDHVRRLATCDWVGYIRQRPDAIEKRHLCIPLANNGLSYLVLLPDPSDAFDGPPSVFSKVS